MPEEDRKKSTIHDVLMRVLQHIHDETKVVVKSLSAEWIDVSTLAGPSMKIRAVSINSSYPTYFEGEEPVEDTEEEEN